MTSPQIKPTQTFRLWPGVVLVVIQWTLWMLPRVWADAGIAAFLGGAVCGLLVIVWWLFFSRAPWVERLIAVPLAVAGVLVTLRLVHPSIANGNMGMMLPIYAIPALSFALVAWAVVSARWTPGIRRAALVGSVALACAPFTLLRTDGIDGNGMSMLRWRWTPTAEERLLAAQASLPAPAPAAPQQTTTPASRPLPDATAPSPAAAQAQPAAIAEPRDATRVPAEDGGAAAAERDAARPRADANADVAPTVEWAGFRGVHRDGAVNAVRIATDWKASPPSEMWRRPVGPAWSSFAVSGDLFYTQEQRGEDEVVACYRLSTGEPVWMHKDRVRFWESNGGAGPRATPAVHDGRVYSMGATGLVNAVDARTGRRIWTRDAAADTGAKLPVWAFSGSPLVVGDLLVVAASGRLIAYDMATGTPRWKGPTTGGGGYSSPHLVTADGVEQIVFQRGGGAVSVSPADGSVLWEHAWEDGASIVQPGVTADGGVLIAGVSAMGGLGLRRLAIARGPSAWTVSEKWTSRGLKPYFNDFVVHKGHAYGFDSSILSAINLETGERVWKGGRYGHGQMVLLRSQDLLLVLAEEGDLALVSATPDKYVEVARVKAIEGKTWNHPVLVGQIVLVRNGEEMAAFRLQTQDRPTE
jgi:outer membrane protein assembly factor BamB